MKGDHIMQTERFVKNMTDQVKELQIKLGYAKETVRLYYPISSLNALLGMSFSDDREGRKVLQKALEQELQQYVFTIHENRMEVTISPEEAERIHLYEETSPFLQELVNLFQTNHHCSLEEICKVFASYPEEYVCEEMPEGTDFDYVIYFKDLSVDEYFYCIKMEMGHTIYHRFMKEDYEQLFF